MTAVAGLFGFVAVVLLVASIWRRDLLSWAFFCLAAWIILGLAFG
jgi:hypothetical protein